MLEYLDNLIAGNEDLLANISNSVLITLIFLTVCFIFILFRQKDLNKLDYHREYINKNYVNVLYSSNWEDEDLPVLLIIPGNPGQAGYYQEYMDLLILHCDEKYRACVLSHVGHSPASDKIFNVKDQVMSVVESLLHITFI